MSNVAQRGFAAGELAPALHAGVDRLAYQGGLKALRNGIVMKTGGIQSRPGTTYKGATKGNTWARLIPCVFDDDQNYLLEFGNGTVRFWKNGTQLTGTSIGSWANATSYAAGIVLLHSGTYYVCLLAHTSNTANDRPNDGANRATYWYALSGLIYELPTPYTTQAVVREMQTLVEVGAIRIAHRSFARRKLTRVADAQWVFTTVTSSVTLDPPNNLSESHVTPGSVVSWVVTAYDSVNLLESVASAAVSWNTEPALADIAVLDWDAVTGATSYRIYKSLNGSVYGYVWEQTTAGPWSDNGSRVIDLSSNPPEEAADLGTSGNYPGVMGGYQQRAILSGTTNDPDTVRASRVASVDDFTVSTPLVDSDAVSWRMVGSRLIRPRHFLEVAKRLVQFANVGEFVIEGDDTGIITPSAVNPRELSANGAAVYPGPLKVNTSALYVQERGGVVRDLLADDASSDVSVTGAHLLAGYTIVEWCYQQTPQSVVWAVRSDGVLLSLTYQRETGILAWARHDTAGTFESIACVPESTEDAVYAVVNRTINASTVRYIERLAPRAGTATTLVCADSAVSYSGVAISTMTGLSHLNGESVSIVADGVVRASPNNPAYTTRTVSGGSVALGGSYTTVHVGLPFTVDVQTLAIDSVSPSRMPGKVHVKQVGLWLDYSATPWVGPDAPSSATALTYLQPMPMEDADENATTTPITGYRDVNIDGAFTPEGSIFLRHVDPSPLTVLAIIPIGDFGRSA